MESLQEVAGKARVIPANVPGILTIRMGPVWDLALTLNHTLSLNRGKRLRVLAATTCAITTVPPLSVRRPSQHGHVVSVFSSSLSSLSLPS